MIHLKSKKWWWPLFCFCVDVAVKNVFQLYRLRKPDALEFKRAIVEGPFCKLFVGLGSTNRSTVSLPFPSSLSVLASCFLLRLFFHLNLFHRSSRNSLFSSVLSDYYGSLDTRFVRGTTRLMSWPGGERYLYPLQSLSSHLWYLLFSDWRRTISSKFFDTQFSLISIKELALPCHARGVLSFHR